MNRSHMVKVHKMVSHLIKVEGGGRNLHQYPPRLAKEGPRSAEHKTTDNKGGNGIRTGPSGRHNDQARHQGADEPE